MNDLYLKMGSVQYKIVERLIQDEEFCKLLRYTDKNFKEQPPVENPDSLVHREIILNPELPDDSEEKGAIVSLLIDSFDLNSENESFNTIEIVFAVLMSSDRWGVNAVAQRPFLIMDRIHKNLNGKNIEGIGKFYIKNGGFISPAGTKLSGYALMGSYDAFNK